MGCWPHSFWPPICAGMGGYEWSGWDTWNDMRGFAASTFAIPSGSDTATPACLNARSRRRGFSSIAASMMTTASSESTGAATASMSLPSTSIVTCGFATVLRHQSDVGPYAAATKYRPESVS